MDHLLHLDTDVVCLLANLNSYDYIIVGSGFGGGPLAEALAAKQCKVLLIERGGVIFSTHVLNTSRPYYNRGASNSPEGNERVYDSVKAKVQLTDRSDSYVGGPVYCIGGRSNLWGTWIPEVGDETLNTYFPPEIVHYLKGGDEKGRGYERTFRYLTDDDPRDGIYPEGEGAHEVSAQEIGQVNEKLNNALVGSQFKIMPVAAQFSAPAPYKFAQGAYSMSFTDTKNPVSADLKILETYPLPPFHQVEEMVDEFLAGFNQEMPLFHPWECKIMIFNWQRFPEEQLEIAWAQINVILALSIRHKPQLTSSSKDLALNCIRNAQSTIDKLISCEHGPDGLRVILGLVILSMDTSALERASMLIGIAVKMVHKMKLHLNSDRTETFKTSSERARLFWITYILDRDLAVLTKEPYLLHDEDIEVNVPGVYDLGGLGTLMDHTGRKRISIFEFRMSLAAIQGMSYKLMSRVRATRMSAMQRESEIRTLDARLMNWYALVPEYFRAGNVKSLDGNLKRQCVMLHIIYFHCIFASRRATAYNSVWIQRLKNYVLENGGNLPGNDKHLDIPDSERNSPLFPHNWKMLVESARSCLTMIELINNSDTALKWRSIPALEACITILAAKTLTIFDIAELPTIRIDYDRISQGMASLLDFISQSPVRGTVTLYSMCSDMFQLVIVHRTRVAGLVRSSAKPIKQEPSDDS